MTSLLDDTLWIDLPAAEARIEELGKLPGCEKLARHLTDFYRDGFLVLENAVSEAAIEAYLGDFDRAAQSEHSIMVSYGRDVFPIAGQDLRKPLLKVLDTHVKIPSALDLALAPDIVEVLRILFEGTPLAFQSLHFEVGSTQAIHQDTAYVVVDRPRRIAAAWIALEDIKPGTGELIYYPGSHRLGEFLYPGNKKHWNPATDGEDVHNDHLRWLHETAKAKDVALASFLPKKGDVLIWHADLAHGGSEILDMSATRRSLVVHYTPSVATPHYFNHIPAERRKKVAVHDGYISSMYYDF